MAEEKPEELDDSLIDGGMPEVEVKPDGSVSLKGDEIPEGVEPVEDDVIEKDVPPKADEPEPDAEPAPRGTDAEQEQVSEIEKKFQESPSLVKRFGTVENMLERMPDTDKYITNLEAERNEYREKATPKEEPSKPPSVEEFYENPVEIVKQLIQDESQSMRTEMSDMKIESFISSKKDFAEMEPFMMEQLKLHPELKSLGPKAAPILYTMAKGVQISRAVNKPNPAPAPVPDKTKAEASVGKKTEAISKDDPRYWRDKTIPEMEDELGFAPD